MSPRRAPPIPALTLALLLAPQAPAVAAGEPETHYDDRLGAIVVPYTGAAPQYLLASHADASEIDFAGPVGRGQDSGTFRLESIAARWAIAPFGAHATRLTVRTNVPAWLTVIDDPGQQRFLVVLQHPPAEPSSPSPATADPSALTPLAPVGEPSAYGKVILPDVPAPAASSPYPGFALAAPGVPRLHVAAACTVASYHEDYLPGSSQVSLGTVAMPGFTFDGAWPWGNRPGWVQPSLFGHLWLTSASYTFQDANLPLSMHSRQEWRSEGVLTRRIGWTHLYLETGLGYFLRWENAASSGAPPQPTYVFSNLRVFHGPELALGGAWTLAEDWPLYLRDSRLYVDGGFSPLAWGVLDPGLPALPPLIAGRVEAGFDRPIGPIALRLCYRYWWTGSFGGYYEVFQGPALEIGNSGAHS